MEDVQVKPGVLNITNYGLGARGVDIGSTNGDVWYPVYDGHGNMVATLSKSGSGYTVSNRRSYDPWGNLRLGSIYTEPTGRYCANLGHKTDDESAMIYMRARYYEPSVGRFISEDKAKQGSNWFPYCKNDPINLVDESGNNWRMIAASWHTAGAMVTFLVACIAAVLPDPTKVSRAIVCGMLAATVFQLAMAFELTDTGSGFMAGYINTVTAGITGMLGIIAAIGEAMQLGMKGVTSAAVALQAFHTMVLLALIIGAFASPDGGNSGFNSPMD